MIDPSLDRDPFELVAESFLARFRNGERPSIDEYVAGHPELADEIRELMPALVLVEQDLSVDRCANGLAGAIVSGSAPRQLGDYQILREVGRGGMGIVYEAVQRSLGRHVALKVLPWSSVGSGSNLERFRLEARAAARLHHTNIVPVFGIGEHDGTHFFAMQFIRGQGLDQVIEGVKRVRGKTVPAIEESGNSVNSSRSNLTNSQRLYFEGVARIGLQVAEALEYAHAQGVLHRDIKPSNLMMDAQGTVWVTDFGLAKAEGSNGPTRTGDFVGTLRYMAPEGFEGRSDPRSDLYSLGATLYELLTLRPLFDEPHRAKLIERVLHQEPVRPRAVDPRIPRDLEVICLKCLNKEPEGRYATARELSDELRHYLASEPIRARRSRFFERAWRWGRRNPAFAGLSSALAAVLVLATAGSLIVAGRMTSLAQAAGRAARSEREAKLEAQQAQKLAEIDRGSAEKSKLAALAALAETDSQREIARQNLYYAQMHLAQQGWREHRGLTHMRELLANWLPGDNTPDRRGWEWFYLNALPFQNMRTLTKTGTSIGTCTVAWEPCGKRLASGTVDGVIQIWDLEREQPVLILRGPPAPDAWWGIRSFAWSPDGGRLATGSADMTLRVWETGSGRQLLVVRGHESRVGPVAYSPDGTQLACWDFSDTIKIRDASTGRRVAEVPGAAGVCSGAWSPDGNLLASGDNHGIVTISDIKRQATILTIPGHVDMIYDLAWSPDGTRVASASADFTAKIWDVASGKLMLGPLRHSHGILSVAWEPGGRRLATGSFDHSVKVWNAATGLEDLALRGHVTSVTSLAWCPDRSRLASGGDDGSVRIWSHIRDQESSQLPGHDMRATSVSWNPDGTRLASGGDDGKVRIWDPVAHKEVLTLKGHDEGRVIPQFGLIRALAWSPDGTRLASGGLDGTAKVWEIATAREVYTLRVDDGRVWSLAWSPDGKQLAAGSEDGTIRVVAGLEHAPEVRTIKAHDQRVRSLAWTSRGNRLASGSMDSLVKVWDMARGVELTMLQGHQRVGAVAWSADGARLAAGCYHSAGDHTVVIVWDPETGRKVSTKRGHNDWVEEIAWSPDGTRLASAGIDNSVRIWDPRTGEETLVLRGNAGMFHSVSWSRDGKRIAAASNDGKIWVWDATLGYQRDTTASSEAISDR
jgi:eukaryotic-like serine/threonine-protein kinase